MRIKIKVKTPKNQAEKCVKSQKPQLLGYKLAGKVVEEGIISNTQFYWILEIDRNDLNKIIQRAAIAESIIKNFYRKLIHWIDRAAWLGKKFNKSTEWIKRKIVAMARKNTNNDKETVKRVEEMVGDDLTGFLTIDDRIEINNLIKGKIVELDYD